MFSLFTPYTLIILWRFVMRKVLLLALGLCLIMSGASFAFHDNGVAHCNGCHTMHNSQDGVAIDTTGPNPSLLNYANPSDVCLSCHAGYGSVLYGDVTTGNDHKTPGGNFVFLTATSLQDNSHGAPISGDAAGHNVVAPAHGLYAEASSQITTSPGGAFPNSQLGCSSCHDPHGTEDFRMLYGAGRVVQRGVATFTADAPVADELSSIMVRAWSAAGEETPTNHTVYRSGMSAWCGNCHGQFHNDALTSQLTHPTNQILPGNIATNYNLYNGTSDITGGAYATAYLVAVPIEVGADTLYNNASTMGANPTARVMCLSCHRAHASSGPDAGRWDWNVTLLDEDGIASATQGEVNPFDANQRSLCNKCHVKDAYDHGAANW